MRKILYASIVFIISSCSKDKCNTDILGTYDIRGGDPNTFYFIITNDHFLLIDVSSNDTSLNEYTINCDELCLNGLCSSYEFKNGVLDRGNDLILVKR